MLSNKDFVDLLSQPEKVRFDLKQISTWDKQNEAKYKKKGSNQKASKSPRPGHEEDTEKEDKAEKYRDRALERRKDVKDETQMQMDDIVQKLDAEQTKYLGGDIEHTHLVKGLDYALLRKVRDETQTVRTDPQIELGFQKHENKKNVLKERPKLITTTQIGMNLSKLLFSNDEVIDESKAGLAKGPSKQKNTVATVKPGILLSKMHYEFDTSIESELELPVTISTSRKEWADEENMNFIIDAVIVERLSAVFGAKSLKIKRKRKDEDSVPQLSSTLQPAAKISTAGGAGGSAGAPVVDIFGDIFENMGKYVPVGALTEDDVKSTSTGQEPGEIVQMPADCGGGGGMGIAKGLFSSLGIGRDISSGLSSKAMDRDRGGGIGNDVLAPVEAVLRAQAEREKIELARLEEAAAGSRGHMQIPEEADPMDGVGLIHRDAFTGQAVTKDLKAKKVAGDFFSVGTYDYYPENMDGEMYYSDEDEGAGGGVGGGGGSGGAKRKGDSAAASSNSAASVSGVGLIGLNRAARRSQGASTSK